MNSEQVIVENYNSEMHGHWDDCDYVVITLRCAPIQTVMLALDIADKLSAGEWERHDDDNTISYYCCHA